MRSTVWTVSCSTIAFAGVLCVAFGSFAEPPRGSKAKLSKKAKSDSSDKTADKKRVSLKVARERAKLMHNIYSATLDVIHHRYFRAEKSSSVPARALEDVFSEIARRESIKANWIAVNTRAMSIDHEPQNDFEKQAAKAIAAGEHEYERVENGTYRRAEGIPLNNRGCLGCHLRFGANGKAKRFAGLIITIPIKKD